MMCQFSEEDFRPAWLAIQPFKTGRHTDNWDLPNWKEFMVRVEADNGMFRIASPFGQAEIPAKIERRGVVFLPLWEFVELMARSYGEPVREFEATDGCVCTNWVRSICHAWRVGLFDDPATAPQTWEPVEPTDDDYDCDDEWEESEAGGDSDEEGAVAVEDELDLDPEGGCDEGTDEDDSV